MILVMCLLLGSVSILNWLDRLLLPELRNESSGAATAGDGKPSHGGFWAGGGAQMGGMDQSVSKAEEVYVAGVVSDRGGQPLSCVRVEASVASGNRLMELAEILTDHDGRFEVFDAFPLRRLEPGDSGLGETDRRKDGPEQMRKVHREGRLRFSRTGFRPAAIRDVYALPEEERIALKITLQRVEVSEADRARAAAMRGLPPASVARVLDLARDEAFKLHHPYIGTEHLMLGLLRAGESVTAELVSRGLNYADALGIVETSVGRAAAAPEIDKSAYPLTPRVEKILDMAAAQAKEQQGRDAARSTHVLRAIMAEGQGVASALIGSVGMDQEELRRRLLEIDAASR